MSSDPITSSTEASSQSDAGGAQISADLVTIGDGTAQSLNGTVDSVEINRNTSSPKIVRTRVPKMTEQGEMAKFQDEVPRDTMVTDSVKRTKAKKDDKVVQKDDVAVKEQSPEGRNDYLSIAQNHVFAAFGGENPYATWKKNKSQNKLSSTEIGFDCDTSSLVETAFKKNVYPVCGMVIGKNLLPKTDISIWVEVYYNAWDRIKEDSINKLSANPIAKGFELMYFEKLNAAVRDMAEKSMTLIMNIKFVTPSSSLEVKGAKPGHVSETKITRISLMMGWVCDLEKAVESAIKAFFKYMHSVYVVRTNMTSSRRKTVLTLLGKKIPAFSVENVEEDEESESEEGKTDPDNDSDELE